MENESVLERMGFHLLDTKEGVSLWQMVKNEFVIIVTVYSTGKWFPIVVMRCGETQLHRQPQNIKDLEDLEDFISYL